MRNTPSSSRPNEPDIRHRYERLQSLAHQARSLAARLRYPLVGIGLLEHAAGLEQEAERLGALLGQRAGTTASSL